MKKILVLILVISTLLLFTACGLESCHYCGKTIEGDSVEAGGRSYCSYDHYMEEFMFGK